ncbi:MAG TPA: hypothetical protein VN808_12635, partial [Stellaceae bacterium]|nr:hypothetical protein [Stellaceae bacterium]
VQRQPLLPLQYLQHRALPFGPDERRCEAAFFTAAGSVIRTELSCAAEKRFMVIASTVRASAA